MKAKSLKESYRKGLWAFLIVNVVVFWLTKFASFDGDFAQLLYRISNKESLYLLVGPVVVLVFNGLVSADNKERLVFWKIDNPLPGSEAFSYHLEREPRANRSKIEAKWGELPSTPNEENSLWYDMLKDSEHEVSVTDSHGNFLFSRDLAAFAALIMAVLGMVVLLSGADVFVKLSYLLFVVVQYIVTATAARNYGIRLVRNVLAVQSARWS